MLLDSVKIIVVCIVRYFDIHVKCIFSSTTSKTKKKQTWMEKWHKKSG